MKRRRAKGEGTLFFNVKLNCWIGRKVLGTSPGGRTLYAERRGGTRAEVVEKLARAGPPGPQVTFGEWAGRWLGTLSVRASTLEGYRRSVLTHCKPIGHVRLTDVKPSLVRSLLVALGETLAPGSVANVRTHAGTCFAAAVADGLVATNPFTAAPRPKGDPKAIDPFTAAELARLVAAWGDTPPGPTVALLAATGMRLGEAAALDVADWDPATGKVSVTKTYSKRFGLGKPKSKHSVRVITVPEQARPALAAAAAGRAAGPLFVTANGNRFVKNLVQRAFRRMLRRLGLRYRNPHQLRHSVATHLISAGHPIGDVAKYLGDSAAVVVKVYLHPAGADAGLAMQALLGQGGG